MIARWWSWRARTGWHWWPTTRCPRTIVSSCGERLPRSLLRPCRSGFSPTHRAWPHTCELLLAACEEQPRLHDGIRVQGHALDALFHEPAREVGVIRRTLAADADVLTRLAA